MLRTAYLPTYSSRPAPLPAAAVVAPASAVHVVSTGKWISRCAAAPTRMPRPSRPQACQLPALPDERNDVEKRENVQKAVRARQGSRRNRDTKKKKTPVPAARARLSFCTRACPQRPVLLFLIRKGAKNLGLPRAGLGWPHCTRHVY